MPENTTMYKHIGVFLVFLLSVSVLSAQSTVTLTDGKFVYRLTVEKLPGQHTRKALSVTNKRQTPQIGFTVGTVKSITIFPVDDSLHKQVIVPGKNESSWPWTEDNKAEKFIIEDMNFDGNNDIRLLNSADNYTYYYWIYQPGSGQFVEDTVLTRLVAPQFYQNQKLVYANWEEANGRETKTYNYTDGKLTLIEEDEIKADSVKKITTIIIKKLVNGKMEVVSTAEVK